MNENMKPNILWKGHSFTIWELKQEHRASPCSNSAGNELWPQVEMDISDNNCASLSMPINHCMSNDLGFASKF